MYKILLIGQGKFPSGVQSALVQLMGENQHLAVLELTEDMNHHQFEDELTSFLREWPQVILFADLTGGAPHQIAAKVILEHPFSQEHFLVSGVPLSVITELTMKFQFQQVLTENAAMLIEQTISECKEMIVQLSVMNGKV